jgi:hypothetical protein
MVVFQIVPRKMPLIMSAPPAKASAATAMPRLGAKPRAVIPAPQPIAAQITASPCRWTRPVQPLVNVATSEPSETAAYKSPSAPAPPNSSANAGKSASGMPKNMAIRSTP